MPNPWRTKAQGRPVYCIQIRLWEDDVSGNVSKQWDKHWMFCMTLAGLPKRLLVQEYFTHFISCSPSATVLEQAAAIVDALKWLSSLLELHDTHTDCDFAGRAKMAWSHSTWQTRKKSCSTLIYSWTHQIIRWLANVLRILAWEGIFFVLGVILVGLLKRSRPMRGSILYFPYV